jgi:hypothetical protein
MIWIHPSNWFTAGVNAIKQKTRQEKKMLLTRALLCAVLLAELWSTRAKVATAKMERCIPAVG